MDRALQRRTDSQRHRVELVLVLLEITAAVSHQARDATREPGPPRTVSDHFSKFRRFLVHWNHGRTTTFAGLRPVEFNDTASAFPPLMCQRKLVTRLELKPLFRGGYAGKFGDGLCRANRLRA